MFLFLDIYPPGSVCGSWKPVSKLFVTTEWPRSSVLFTKIVRVKLVVVTSQYLTLLWHHNFFTNFTLNFFFCEKDRRFIVSTSLCDISIIERVCTLYRHGRRCRHRCWCSKLWFSSQSFLQTVLPYMLVIKRNICLLSTLRPAVSINARVWSSRVLFVGSRISPVNVNFPIQLVYIDFTTFFGIIQKTITSL